MKKIDRESVYFYPNDRIFRYPFDHLHYFVERNYDIRMHMQEFFEVNIVTRGQGVHYIEDNSVQAEVGDVFIIPPEVAHGYAGGDGFDVFHILISNTFMQRNIVDLQRLSGFSILFNVEPMMRAKTSSPLYLKLTPCQFKRIMELFSHYPEQEVVSRADVALVNTGLLYIFISEICKIYNEGSSDFKTASVRTDAVFMRAISLIHERFGEKLTIDELAAEAKLSRSSFIRKFIHICKMTPAEYITKKRIEVAENMLRNSNTPVVAIAESVGFYDAAHFSRTFKKLLGKTPIEYRKDAMK